MRSRILAVFLSLFIIAVPSFAKGLILGFQAGLSMPSASNWNAGFTLCGNGFYEISPSFAVGGIFAFHRWGPDGEELLRSGYFPGGLTSLTVTSTSGGLSNVEIIPAVRLFLPMGDNQRLGLFALVGAGLYIQSGEASASGSYTSGWGYGTVTTTITVESKTSLILTGGVGLEAKIGRNLGIVIYPAFAFLVQDSKPKSYFCIRAGIMYALPGK